MNNVTIKNNESIPVRSIPVLHYDDFLNDNIQFIKDHPERHCVMFFGYPCGNEIALICCIADDKEHTVRVTSSNIRKDSILCSFTAHNFSFEKFERELNENFGINYSDHPWLKPVRFPENVAGKTKSITDYPFYRIKSEELHEVGVGPVHAGIIEPGHFRFICNGEQILHLEIQLGYQHRGVEQLFIDRKKIIQRTVLAESIAGDSVVEHASAFAFLMESLAGIKQDHEVLFARTLAQELERIAIHTGDLSAVCTDVAYQLGSSVFGRLRTPIINFFQEWCGNRLVKGLIRPGFNPFPFTKELGERLKAVLGAFEPDFIEMNQELSKLPSSLSRFERTGTLKYEQLLSIGTVGMAARMNALERDIRLSHPYGLFSELDHRPVIKHHGDVYSRVQIRKEEVLQSISYIRKMIENIPDSKLHSQPEFVLKPSSFVISLTEGWRGETCHAAITNDDGEISVYKIKDPSFHNWLALALAVRNNEISDFPICNKSFDLSYCGHDL
ncbi:MAG TPA: NADH-quinone oxidoreductase subunit C [Bacteroidales bacterium]|nr:NADH-quinone oxidoreductase subunit C [Bacteroidales bacterium]